jgi:hypothetical protein
MDLVIDRNEALFRQRALHSMTSPSSDE